MKFKGGKDLYVMDIFNRVSSRYDLMNTIMSWGLDKTWRRIAAISCSFSEGSSLALDLCSGTGMLALELARVMNFRGRVLGLDFSRSILEIAINRVRGSNLDGIIEFIEGDALNLPLPSNMFDCVTIAFCLRNVISIRRLLEESVRVAKPGGRVIVLDLSKPRSIVLYQLYNIYLRLVVPLIGWLITGHMDPYAYLPDSLREFPVRESLSKIMREEGLSNVKFIELTLGTVAIHIGVKPIQK